MYKYNKYKQKYLNLLYGSGDKYNINVTNIAGKIIYTIILNDKDTITIEELKLNIIESKNDFDDLYFELLLDTTLLDNEDIISTDWKDDDKDINLTIIKQPVKTLYTILWNDMKYRIQKYNNILFDYIKTIILDMDLDYNKYNSVAEYSNKTLKIFIGITFFIIYDCNIQIYYDENSIIIIIQFDKLNNLDKLNNIYNYQTENMDLSSYYYDYNNENIDELEFNLLTIMTHYSNGIVSNETFELTITIPFVNDTINNEELSKILSFIEFMN